MTSKATVSCGTHLDIQHSETLKERFLAALAKDVDVCVINASKVERVDSAGLQLIAAFVKQANHEGLQINWQKPSDEFNEGVKLLGMHHALALKE